MSYLAAGLACAFAALCYAEFASMIPIAGSAYTYAYATLGELVAWMIGWDLILEYAVGSMTVAIGWSGYMQRLLAGRRHHAADGARRRAAGRHHQHPGRPHRARDHDPAGHRRPRIGARQRDHGRHQAGRGAVLHRRRRHLRQARELVAVRAVRLVGHHGRRRRSSSSPTSGSTRSRRRRKKRRIPKRDLPIGIIASLVVCTVLYLAVAAVLSGIVPVVQFRSAADALPGRADRVAGRIGAVPQRAGGLRARGDRAGLGARIWSRPARSPASPRCCSSCS